VGDHGCEYMTRGVAVVLGPTGRNFAAGMSGGVAYVWDPQGQLSSNLNTQMVAAEALGAQDRVILKEMIQKHYQYTGSDIAESILAHWETKVSEFVLVMPTDYKKALLAQAASAGAK
jgi:glutamate synthase (NADPH/NADH) large chain